KRMFRSYCCPAFLLSLSLISRPLPAVAQASRPTAPPAEIHAQQRPAEPPAAYQAHPPDRPSWHIVPYKNRNAPVGLAAPAGAKLAYFGGPVISNVDVVEVLYGNGAYMPQINQTKPPSLPSFFSDITTSGFIKLLSQYSTPASGGTNQKIGNGTFEGVFQIAP